AGAGGTATRARPDRRPTTPPDRGRRRCPRTASAQRRARARRSARAERRLSPGRRCGERAAARAAGPDRGPAPRTSRNPPATRPARTLLADEFAPDVVEQRPRERPAHAQEVVVAGREDLAAPRVRPGHRGVDHPALPGDDRPG